MRITSLVWDDDTVDHIARHGVSPDEAEAVCRRRPVALRARYGRYLLLGQTEAGRYLTLVVTPLGDARGKLITARMMTDVERRFYLRR